MAGARAPAIRKTLLQTLFTGGETMARPQNTPGYNSRITVRIKSDKNGRPMAHFWGMARRWIKMNMEEARMLIATDQAWDHNDA